MKKTKIICSIGPASNNYETFKKLAESGMNVARVNFSHATIEERQLVEDLVNKVNSEGKMAKILLVEDDQSLREIYSIRLTAEGYEIVSAGDGEEALASAVREKPDLVLSDVMMPKISGFDMLDILRQTPETKDIKVIMMTALSSEDQRERGNALGADRYLVKSQVGIEDVVNAVHDVLGDNNGAAAQPAQPEQPAQPAAPAQ